MFELDFSLLPEYQKLQSKKSRESLLDYELAEEVEAYFTALEKHGVVSGAKDPGRQISLVERDGETVSVVKLAFQVDGSRFKFSYSIEPNSKVVAIESLEIKRIVDPKVIEAALSEPLNNQNFEGDLPQADRPTDIIKALELVHSGYNTSLEVGKRLGHLSEKDKDIARHGCYKLNAAINLHLAERYKSQHKTYYKLTDKGLKIAELGSRRASSEKGAGDVKKDISAQYQLMVEAMLNYYPVRIIFDEIIQPGRELGISGIKECISSKIRPRYHSQATIGRRARSLTIWMVWMTMLAGIPIARAGAEDSHLVQTLFSKA